ncbi:MAG: TetR/AcrR family transcriptional regulator [Chloroflexota bacterium]
MSEKQSQNKPMPELSASVFVTTALQLAEQSGGMQTLSMRKLGNALGVDATAVYRYFPNKAALVEAMMQQLAHGFVPSSKELDGDWRVRLTALARRAYRIFSTYPSLTIHLPSSPYIRSPIGDQLMEIGYKALVDAGLSDEHVVLFHELLYTFVLGMGQVNAQFEDTLETERRLTREHVATISTEDFPNLHQLAHLMVVDSEPAFQLMLEIYLNAVEAYASGTPE